MKLFLIIALVAVVAVVVLALTRSGPRVTKIDHRREREEDDDA